MNYHVVFEVSQKGYNGWAPAFGLIFFITGLVMILRPAIFSKTPLARVKSVGRLFVIFSFFWILLVLTTTGAAYLKATKAYQDGSYQTVEGVVTEFVPMPRSGHALESFSVNGKTFRYSDYSETPGFNNTRSHGGPIHEGLPVRIGYLGNIILKLEVAE